MNNKKILYILTIIITLFSFNIKANAAQELICLYKKGINDDKLMLKQDYTGNKFVYLNSREATKNDENWIVQSNYDIVFEFDINSNLLDSSNNLTACPPYSELASLRRKVLLYDSNVLLSQPLQKQYTSLVESGNVSTIIGEPTANLTCSDLFSGDEGEALLNILKTAMTLVKIAIPILLIALGIMDFTKAIFAGKEDDMKKAQGKFMKRIAIGICVFLVPTLLKLILTIANIIWADISPDFCGIL